MPATELNRLVAHLTAGTAIDAADELRAWMTSRRARSWAESHRDKIRKKLRGAADAEARRDVLAELHVGLRLAAERHTSVGFEAHGAGNAGPDFTLIHRGDRPVNVEVTRPRRSATAEDLAGPILAKLRQLPAGAPNVVVLVTDSAALPGPDDLAAAVRLLRARIEEGDDAHFVQRGWAGTKAVADRLRRLGALVAWPGAGTATAWAHRNARIAVPERSLRAIVAALGGGEH